MDGTLVMLASVVVKYFCRPEQSSNKIQILETKFKFEKKFNISTQYVSKLIDTNLPAIAANLSSLTARRTSARCLSVVILHIVETTTRYR